MNGRLSPITYMFGDVSAVSSSMQGFVTPAIVTLIGLASVAVVFFLVLGGIYYIGSTGNPEKVAYGKKIITNALIGLVIVIAAGTFVALLSNAYSSGGTAPMSQQLPALESIEESPSSGSVSDVLVGAITGFLRIIAESSAGSFLSALAFFTASTPLMAENSAVFNLWLAMVVIANALLILVVALLGFHVMSFAAFGLEEVDLRQLLPRIGLLFLLINTSLFLIDGIISVSNGMISALQAGFGSSLVWDSLLTVLGQSDMLSVAALLLMLVFIILSVMLLIYYVMRLIVLYIGAVLAPLIFLVWILPGFRDFSESCMKTYVMTIFVLFVHVVILLLAASLFMGVEAGTGFNPIMSLILGLATLLTLLKTQSVMAQMSYMSLGSRTASKLGTQLVTAMSHYSKTGRSGGREQDERYPRPPQGNNTPAPSRGVIVSHTPPPHIVAARKGKAA